MHVLSIGRLQSLCSQLHIWVTGIKRYACKMTVSAWRIQWNWKASNTIYQNTLLSKFCFHWKLQSWFCCFLLRLVQFSLYGLNIYWWRAMIVHTILTFAILFFGVFIVKVFFLWTFQKCAYIKINISIQRWQQSHLARELWPECERQHF